MTQAKLARLPGWFAKGAAILVFLTGASGLAGWLFDIEALKSVVEGWAKMSAVTSVAFILGGISLWFAATAPVGPAIKASEQDSAGKSWRQSLSLALSVALVLIGLAKLILASGGWDAAFDRLWFSEKPGPSGPGQMLSASGFNLVLIGLSLLLATRARPGALFLTLTILSGLVGWLGLQVYLFGGVPLLSRGPMAVHTSIGFVLLSAGVLCLRTDTGLMELLVSDSPGGVLARRLVPAVLILPVVFGWLLLRAQRQIWIGTEEGIAIFACANALVFGGLIWAEAALLNRTEAFRRQAEEQIRGLNAELERRVHERTQALTDATKEMEAFTYSVAHDLRAPLRHIEAFANILSQDSGTTLSLEGQRCVGSIRRANAKMSQLVEDLLGLARVAQRELKRQPTALGSVVAEVVNEAKHETLDRLMEWRIHPLPTTECDPLLVKTLLTNLLSNAVKYTLSRSPALIEVGSFERDGQAVVYVRDNGVGFNMAFADKLFGVFQRLHHSAEFEGTGIGLAIAERIVRKHQGRIWAEGAVDQGATFYFTLAAAPPSQVSEIGSQPDTNAE